MNEGEAMLREATARLEDSEGKEARGELAGILVRLAETIDMQDRHAEAAEVLTRALVLNRDVHGEDHPAVAPLHPALAARVGVAAQSFVPPP